MESLYWADQACQRIIREKGDKKRYTVAAGITPSGVVHIGNFREIITVDLVCRALASLGKQVRFIYSWDDYDVLRKVPVNLPKQELLEKHLRMPISRIPDVFGCHASYAEHHEKAVEDALPAVGISPEFISQTKRYQSCAYAEGMRTALEETSAIMQILNKYRKEPLAEGWLPVTLFCERCSRDTATVTYPGDYTLSYTCSCGHRDTFDFRKKGIAKLKWRIDWPMRWEYEKVDFEPGGKDHSADGGSRMTGEEIVQQVFHHPPPTYQFYEFIGIKGGEQFSSSAGVATTLQDVLEVYTPEVVRFLFAGSRPNTEFSISFDLDVLKIYEDFDKCERVYYGKERLANKKEEEQFRRIYEMSVVEKPAASLGFQPGFRHLTTVLQTYANDLERVRAFYGLKKKGDVVRLQARAACAWRWLQKYAPDDFRFTLQEKADAAGLSESQRKALRQVAKLLAADITEEQLYASFYSISKELDMQPQELFVAGYRVLLAKDRGPKLAPFIFIVGKERARKMFERV
ncbi:MAG TPA: lysine--tRNA ligase [Candidatus Nanoarchaeia archaeon]|nr:lysine--tRNA ligase [Candidatus Nanoarchaeia archaeon]